MTAETSTSAPSSMPVASNSTLAPIIAATESTVTTSNTSLTTIIPESTSAISSVPSLSTSSSATASTATNTTSPTSNVPATELSNESGSNTVSTATTTSISSTSTDGATSLETSGSTVPSAEVSNESQTTYDTTSTEPLSTNTTSSESQPTTDGTNQNETLGGNGSEVTTTSQQESPTSDDSQLSSHSLSRTVVVPFATDNQSGRDADSISAKDLWIGSSGLVMVAFFDTQSIAVMAQSRCGSEGQRSLFESHLLIAPVAFWGELQGAVVGTLAVLASIALAFAILSLFMLDPLDDENRFTKSLVRAKAGLWLVALMALLPGLAFASVRLLATASSWLPLGIVSAVIITSLIVGLPLLLHFGMTRSWAPPNRSEGEIPKGASGVAIRFANFLVIERSSIVSTSAAGVAMSPVVVWRPRQAAWAVLPFVSGVVNALLLGPVGEESNGTGLCTGLFAASAVVHAGLAILVATARPHTTRLQNFIAAASFSLTGGAAAISAAWATQPYQAASTSELLLLIVWCLHWLASVARIGVEVWLLPTLADAAQANEELPKVSPAVLPTSTSLPPGSHGYDMTDSFDLDQCIVDEALSMAAEKSVAESMTAPAAKPSSFLYRTTAWEAINDSPLAKAPDCDAVIQSPVNSVAPNESVKEEPTTIIDFGDDPYTSSGEDDASYSAPEEYQQTADRLSRQLSMHSEDDSVSTPVTIDGGGESQVMNGDARSQIDDEDEDLKQEVLDSDDDCMLFNGNDRGPHDEVVAGNVPRPQADAHFHKSEAERSGRISSSDLDSQYSDGGGSGHAQSENHRSSLQNRSAINDAVANAFIYDIAEEEDLF
eukprot:GILI01008664.1.p1 GENE.GILI01008664.1~~GILI01008664.1.p1  ORF type:complete len:840 (+),score=157.65 GILI01008664.1:28-2520(+)